MDQAAGRVVSPSVAEQTRLWEDGLNSGPMLDGEEVLEELLKRHEAG